MSRPSVRRALAALGLTPDEWIERRISGRIRLTREERRQVVEANPQATTRELAEATGVSHHTIARDRRSVANATEPDAEPDPEPLDIAEVAHASVANATEPDPEQNNVGWQPNPDTAGPEPDTRPKGRATPTFQIGPVKPRFNRVRPDGPELPAADPSKGYRPFRCPPVAGSPTGGPTVPGVFAPESRRPPASPRPPRSR